MPENLLSFAFKGNISEQVLYEIDTPNKLVITSTCEGVEHLLQEIKKLRPSEVIGLGMYSGRDKKYLRIETLCNRNFRNDVRPEQITNITPFLNPLKFCKFAKGLGNSYCNLASLLIVNSERPPKYAFIHIPKSFDKRLAINEVDLMLKEYLLQSS